MDTAEGDIRRPLKEKIVKLYESFLNGERPDLENKNFWNEFFLLRPNVLFLQKYFNSLTIEQLNALKVIVNHLFYHCVTILQDGNEIRTINSLQTLSALVYGVYSKAHGDYGFNLINILIGFSHAENLMQNLIEELKRILFSDNPPLKSQALKFLLTLVTACDNISQNTLLEYLMIFSAFEAIIQILNIAHSRQYHGYDAVLLLTLLINYRKHEASNPYIVELSIVDNEMYLNGFANVISRLLLEFNRNFSTKEHEQRDMLSSLTNLIGGIFLPDSHEHENRHIKANNAVLLAFYEMIHLNRNFLTTLTHVNCHMSTSSLVSGALTEDNDKNYEVSGNDLPSSNLLVTFLEFSSIIMLNTKDETAVNTCKLCFIILTCITEDQYANSIIHDMNLVYRVQLHKMRMRHRKAVLDSGPFQPLACPILDLMVEFILSHMTKSFPYELYLLCLGVVHRILCYQKRGRVRLNYSWKDLLNALITLIKFLISQEAMLSKQCNIFKLCNQVMIPLNLFITFGDTFLPSPSCYDELYYEIIRMSQVFDNIYQLTLRYTTCESEWKSHAANLMNSLVNVRAIINHFTPKITANMVDNNLSALTEVQVLDVVRSNYDSLTLKLYDNLDQYEKYTEKPIESAFFTPLVRTIVAEYRLYSLSVPKSTVIKT